MPNVPRTYIIPGGGVIVDLQDSKERVIPGVGIMINRIPPPIFVLDFLPVNQFEDISIDAFSDVVVNLVSDVST